MKEYQNRPVTSNAIIVNNGEVLLVRRINDPFKDYWAIPGGFVEITEGTKQAAIRELLEETGVHGEVINLVGVFDSPDRDPRRNTICIAYLIKPVASLEIKASDDAKEVRWFVISNLPKLAFDHKSQIEAALKLLDK